MDNWHLARIPHEVRLQIYNWLKSFAGSAILFTDKFYEVNKIANKNAVLDPSLPSEESITTKYELIGLSHAGRAELIPRSIGCPRRRCS